MKHFTHFLTQSHCATPFALVFFYRTTLSILPFALITALLSANCDATPLNATNQSPEIQCDALCESTHSVDVDGVVFTLAAARDGAFETMVEPEHNGD